MNQRQIGVRPGNGGANLNGLRFHGVCQLSAPVYSATSDRREDGSDAGRQPAIHTNRVEGDGPGCDLPAFRTTAPARLPCSPAAERRLPPAALVLRPSPTTRMIPLDIGTKPRAVVKSSAAYRSTGRYICRCRLSRIPIHNAGEPPHATGWRLPARRRRPAGVLRGCQVTPRPRRSVPAFIGLMRARKTSPIRRAGRRPGDTFITDSRTPPASRR